MVSNLTLFVVFLALAALIKDDPVVTLVVTLVIVVILVVLGVREILQRLQVK